LLVAHIPPVCSLLAPCERGASTQEGDQFIFRRTLSCYPGSSVSTAGCHATTRRRVAIGGAFLSADAVTHEFGHGFLWDPTSRVRTVASDGLSLTSIASVSRAPLAVVT